MKKQIGWLAVVGVALAAAVITLAGSRAVEMAMTRIEEEKQPEMAVLMYHAVIDNKNKVGSYVITPEALRSDLEYIKKSGYTTVVMSDIIAYVRDCVPLPKKPIMITFDDGYYNNYLYAFPLLQEFQMKAVISIIAAETEKYSSLDEKNANYSHLTWDMVNEMMESGLVEFQNHTYNMHKVGKRKGVGKCKGESTESYQSTIREDIGHAQQLYQDNTGWLPNTFAYPFGTYCTDSYPVLEELGFSASPGVEGKLFRPTHDGSCLVRIPRFNRPWGTTAQAILKKALGN